MLSQILHITLINLRSIPERLGSTVVMIVGIAGVVGVLTSMLALASGLADTLNNSAREDRVVILSENVTFVGQSSLSIEQVNAIASAPGLATTRDGRPAITKDARISLILAGRQDGVLKGVVVRGFSPEGFEVRPEIKLVEGRMFKTGVYEAIVGRHARSQFLQTNIGDQVALLDGRMKVVGVFESGDWVESGFITDADTLLGAYGRTSTNAVIALLENKDTLSEFEYALSQHASLKFQVLREPAYYDRLTDAFSLLDRVAKFVGAVLAVGGFFCSFNVMYSAVSSRDVEIATYKAIGFGSSGVVISVVVESLIVALVGSLIGAATAWMLFDGNTVTTGSYNASVVHNVYVSPRIILVGVGLACSIACLGALIPAVQAARMPVTSVLRRL